MSLYYSDVEDDDNDIFGVLDEDNESYLAEMSIPSLSHLSYNLNERNLPKSIKKDEDSDYRKNVCNLQPEFDSRYCIWKAKAGVVENLALKHKSATTIQKYWRRYVRRKIFRRIRDLLIKYSGYNSSAILRSVNPREADLMDRASGTFIRFRLSGEIFPPFIVYKIFTKRPIVDLCKQQNHCVFDIPSKSSNREVLPEGKKNFVKKFVSTEIGKANDEKVDRNDWRPFLGSLMQKPKILNFAIKNKDAISTRTLKKRKSKLELIRKLYENGRQKEREIKMTCGK